MKGGKVLGSGTYGCIFKPALQCKGQDSRKSNFVTKLMMTRNANEEYEEVQRLVPYIKSIPQYKKYFVLDDITKCEPINLTKDDLEDFNTKCGALKNHQITAALVENEIKKGRVLGLELPDGGISVKNFLAMPTTKKEDVVNYLQALKNLISEGIRPMNQNGVIHQDVKSDNMVYNPETKELKLIDWGLAKVLKNISDNPLLELPLMFNEPLTNLLFYNYVIAYVLYDAIKNNGQLTKYRSISDIKRMSDPNARQQALLNDIYSCLWENIFKSKEQIIKAYQLTTPQEQAYFFGHYDFIVAIYFPGDETSLRETITKQLAHAIYTYSYDPATNVFQSFNSRDYLNNVFKMNVDVFGALSSLYDVGKTDMNNKEMLDKIIDIRDTIMFSSIFAAKPYDLTIVSKKLDELCQIIDPTFKTRTTVLGGRTRRRAPKKQKKRRNTHRKTKN